jgi:predicted CXXCH cytochrome family protein
MSRKETKYPIGGVSIMKRILVVLIAIIFVAGMAGMASAGITGSKHDFTTGGASGQGQSIEAGSTGQICKVCHAPHNAVDASTGPLWNHLSTTVSAYGLYVSPTSTLDTTVSQPGTTSKLCLSCHDGTVALDSYGAGATDNDGTKISGVANVGTDLADDHPIGFTYDTALATSDGELATPASASEVTSGDYPLFSGSQFECATCHDAHNTGTGEKFLRETAVGSAICKVCHNK